jgi:hypothetical protein
MRHFETQRGPLWRTRIEPRRSAAVAPSGGTVSPAVPGPSGAIRRGGAPDIADPAHPMDAVPRAAASRTHGLIDQGAAYAGGQISRIGSASLHRARTERRATNVERHSDFAALSGGEGLGDCVGRMEGHQTAPAPGTSSGRECPFAMTDSSASSDGGRKRHRTDRSSADIDWNAIVPTEVRSGRSTLQQEPSRLLLVDRRRESRRPDSDSRDAPRSLDGSSSSTTKAARSAAFALNSLPGRTPSARTSAP